MSRWRRATGGYSSAERLIVTCDDGSSAFVKGATDTDTAAWLRAEHEIYARVRGRFLPELLAWQDDDGVPFLVIEDLSAAAWPPPWTPRRIDAVLETLSTVAAVTPPDSMESMEDRRSLFAGWPRVAADPAPFLRLGIASEEWLVRALDVLLAAEKRAQLDGEALLHNDVRSDNLCFVGERVVLVDWNWACRGNPAVDIGAWPPSLHNEGGPPPEAILPDAPEMAALVSGFYAAHAGLPPNGVMPKVRGLQLAQLRTSLPWAIRALGLPPCALDGGAGRQ